ncbi:NAD(P)-dependent oxidoreductase [Aeromonas hydrophila]|nr:NAD(P)-dependent oxidoreductase [Aeromonas hydrophila]
MSIQGPIILLLGATGQLGYTLLSSYKDSGLSVVQYDMRFFNEKKLNDIVLQLKTFREVVIINACAYTNVERAEIESDSAFFLNRDIPKKLANISLANDVLLVHFSTDYVFDGEGSNAWKESDKPNPKNVYGLSKLQGEQAISSSHCRYLILRTSWLHSPYRKNFVKVMLNIGNLSKNLSVVYDQIGSPTSSLMLAEVTLASIRQVLINPAMYGLYHVTGLGEVSRYDYAKFIFEESYKLGILNRVPVIIPVTTCNHSKSVYRPLNSRLNTHFFSDTFGLYLPSWEIGVRETLQKIASR